MKSIVANLKVNSIIFFSPSDIYITISSSSVTKVKFSLRLFRQSIFRIEKFDQPITEFVSPSAPIFFHVMPDKMFKEGAVMIKFESNDEICAIMSVQNVSCPVYDLDRNIKFEGIYQTVNK